MTLGFFLRRHTRLSRSMSRKNIRRPLILLFLLLQTLTIIASAILPKTPVSLLIPPASTPYQELISHNATSPKTTPNIMDYHIVGTPLVLRITETGLTFTERAVNEIIDFSIRLVVRKINTGFGGEKIDHGRFSQLSAAIDMRIVALEDANFTYFVLGDVLAGVWQYMNQPWSSFREIVFDVFIDGPGPDYIGFGRFALRPEKSSLGRNVTSVLSLAG